MLILEKDQRIKMKSGDGGTILQAKLFYVSQSDQPMRDIL